jgi:hypothetical protein
MITIPKRDNKLIKQFARSKILGDIWSSFNLDVLSELGVIKVSPRLRINTAGVSNQGRAVAFRDFDTKIFALCGTKIFNSASHDLISAFTEDTSVGAPTLTANMSDMEIFNDNLCVTSNSKFYTKAESGSGTGAYTDQYTFSASTTPHKLCYFQKHNRLYTFDSQRQVISFGTSSWTPATSGNYFINLTQLEYTRPHCMATDNNYIWIGSINRAQTTNLANEMRDCVIIVWDGISNQATAEYRIRASGILGLCKDSTGTMHALDTSGRLLKFNGGGFTEIDRLPLDRELLTLTSTINYDSFLHPNGFVLSKNGSFLFNFNNLIGDNGATIKENMPSGVWERTEETGFIHRQSYTYTTLASSTSTDYGQNRVSAVGAIFEPNIASSSSSGKPTLICGATYYTNSSSTADGIFVDDPLNTIQKYGYFVSRWIMADEIKDMWQTIVLKYRQFLTSGDSITLKYRIREVAPTEATITWTSTSSFTSTTDISAYVVGDEVEVIQGTGSGKCAHISTISSNAGTYTVTLDDTFTGATGTAKARLQKWIKLSTIANQYTESTVVPLGVPSERIQIKCCMQFRGNDELYELALVKKAHEKFN